MSQAKESNNQKWTQIAREGTFNDSQGRAHTFTLKDFEDIINNYSTIGTQSPLVLGHVESDSAPAYGWVNALKTEEGNLFAQFACVSEKVKEIVHKGYYKNVSMSVDVAKKRLLHVALLGAAAPAIDGIGEINFASPVNKENETIEIVFSADFAGEIPPAAQMAQTPQTHEDNMNVEELAKKVEELMKKVAELEAEVKQKDAEKTSAEANTETAKAEFSAYKAKEADEKRKNRVKKLIDDGKLEPAKHDEVLAFANQLAKSPADFSMGTNSTDGAHSMSMEEKYLGDMEKLDSSPLFASFSQKPAHADSGASNGYIDPQSITSKM